MDMHETVVYRGSCGWSPSCHRGSPGSDLGQIPCGIYGGQIGTGIGSPPRLLRYSRVSIIQFSTLIYSSSTLYSISMYSVVE